ncbi:hypothetical protein Tco_0800163 [Tanacetum coccineum]|uniref:Uncharacterized protein n=1 Tax=Tanacetum coccineum TaxID=301880 RepID=A0ABQ4ZSC1_9ASTR
MENANPPPTNNRPVLPVVLRARAVQELHELQDCFAFCLNYHSGTSLVKALYDTSSSSRTYITHAVDVDIRPVNDQVPFAEVQLTAQHNVLYYEQMHTEAIEPIYDTLSVGKGPIAINS